MISKIKFPARLIILLLLFSSTGIPQWITYNLPHYGIAYCVSFYDLNNGVNCGHTLFPFNEKPYYTTNSGINWITAQCPSTIRAVTNVQFVNANTLYAAGAENLVLLNNSLKISEGLRKYPGFIKNSMIRIGKTGFQAEYEGAFLKSTNAGLSWQKVMQFDTLTGYLMDLYFFNENTGFVIADSTGIGNTRVLKTINGGINWTTFWVEPKLNLRKLLFINNNTGFISGFKNFDSTYTGLIFRTTNAGVNWVKTNFEAGEEIKDISFANSTTGFAICQGSPDFKIYKTLNSGETWDAITYSQNVLSESINTIPGTGNVFVLGTVDSSLYFKTFTAKSTDYGSTWAVKYFYWNDEIIHSCLIDQNNWFICGGSMDYPAVVLKSTNGGTIYINEISSVIPDKYLLYQNYPNPFNPTTIIRYRLVEKGTTTLKIFDIAGKEVKAPVNKKQNAGEYEVTFDGDSFPSGIYIYRLMSGNYSEAKKMILIK